MSSTNRGAKRPPHDYYETPQEAIGDFLTAWRDDCPALFPLHGPILDPCAGGENRKGFHSGFRSPAYPYAFQFHPGSWAVARSASVISMDIREDSTAQVKGVDYLNTGPGIIEQLCGGRPRLIISNPPFSLAQEFIERALEDVSDEPGQGWVVFLLRLNFFESARRLAFWKKYMPRLTYVHSNRLSFTQDGKTDSIAYMHCCWQKGVYPSHTQLRVI